MPNELVLAKNIESIVHNVPNRDVVDLQTSTIIHASDTLIKRLSDIESNNS